MYEVTVIPLTQGQISMIDTEDWSIVRHYSWCADKTTSGKFYAKTTVKRSSIRLHSLIMNCPKGFEVDHINGNTLDNRKANLRVCSHSENCKNQPVRKNNSSGFTGVTFNKEKQKWTAQITINKKVTNLGRFNNKEDAILAYKTASELHFGEFRRKV